MANTLTLSSSGKIAYEDFAGQTDDADATSSEYTLTPYTGEGYIVKTIDSVKCITQESTSWNYENNSIAKSIDYSGGELFCSYWFYCPTAISNRQHILYQAYGTPNVIVVGNFISGGFAWWTEFNTYFYGVYSCREDVANEWHIVQMHLKPGTRNRYRVIRQDNMKIVGGQESSVTVSVALGNYTYQWGHDSRGGIYYATKYLMGYTTNLTVTGLTAGMAVQVLNAGTDAVELSNIATTTSVTLDLWNFIEDFPFSKKLRVLGTDGSTLVTTDASTIYPGDSWAYSGETAGASGSAIINILNNGV